MTGLLAVCPSLYAQETTGKLPLGKDLVGDDYQPRPFGIGFNFWRQTQDYSIKSIDVDNPMLDALSASADKIGVENELYEYNAKFDVWLLPFLNVFGILGNVRGETNVLLKSILENIENVKVEYNGLVYGGGFTAAAGTDRFFGSFTTTFTDTNLDTTDSDIKTWVLTPKAGIHFKRNGVLKHVAVWGGAMGQYLDERHRGTIEIPLGPSPISVPFDVTLEQKNIWNGLAGASFDIATRWVIETEAGFGNRNSVLGALTYRFTK
jgi:hypothetical protein